LLLGLGRLILLDAAHGSEHGTNSIRAIDTSSEVNSKGRQQKKKPVEELHASTERATGNGTFQIIALNNKDSEQPFKKTPADTQEKGGESTYCH
jgi:hypothetical protein